MRMSGSRRLWMILALAVVVAAVYWPSSRVLAEQWADVANITFTHGWLILAVSLWLIFRARGAIAAASVRPSAAALLALAVCSFAWLVCYRASIQDLHITLQPALFWLAVCAAFGFGLARLLIFPVAFFYLAEPSLAQLTSALQELTVLAMQAVLALTGPSAQISGALIHIPNGTFAIEEGCSGLHFMIVGIAVAALHGELRADPWKTRVAQLAFMAALALLGNWVRVYVVIQAGYLTNMRSSLLANHYWFGWGVFAVALLVFFWVRGRFDPPLPPLESAPQRAVAGAVLPGEMGGMALALLVLVGLPGVSALLRAAHTAAPLEATVESAPRAPWAPALVDIHSSWQPVFAGAAREERHAFTNANETVEVFAVTYRAQRQGAKLFGAGSSLLGSQLQPLSRAVIAGPAGAFGENEVADQQFPHPHSLIWSRYETASRQFVSPLLSQLWYGVHATVSNPAASLVAFRAACRPDCASARRTLQGFAASGAVR
jgi:exosortase